MQKGKHKEKRNFVKPVLILFFVLAAGILSYYSLYYGLLKKIDSGKCPADILPEKILILESQSDLYGRGYDERYVIRTKEWANGLPIIIQGNESNYSESLKPDCPKGTAEGQNSDYLYCKEIFYDAQDNAGRYSVRLVLEPIANERGIQKYFLVNRIYGNYSIANATCTRI